VTNDALTPDLDPARLSALQARVTELLPALRQDLEALARIPSVSLAAFDQAHVEVSAQAVAELLRVEGLAVEIVREGGQPAVIGHLDGPEGAPTVMLYAHHDVQPPGAESEWDSPPFEPTEREGRVYARGIADDKAGVMAHIAALRAHSGGLPVSVTVFVEGEEEIGSDSLGAILEQHGEKLRADAIVLADSANWAVGEPALTTTLRGVVRIVLTVRTLDHGIHSGMFGGVVPDAITALVRMIASLHDAEGNVTVAGLKSGVASDLDYSEQRLREESGLLDGVELIGSGSILTRMWTKPSITTIGIDAPSVATSSNTLVPQAAAKISMRIAPDEDPREAFQLLADHERFLMSMAEPSHPEEAVAKEHLNDAGRGVLRELVPKMRSLADWTAPAISATLKETVKALNVKMPQVMMPFRVAVTGQAQTPAIDAIAAALKKDVVLQRMERAAGS